MAKLVIRARLCSWTGYGDHLSLMVSALERFGHEIAIRPMAIDERLMGLPIPIKLDLKKNIVQRQQSDPWELLLSPPNQIPTPGKKTAYFTMWESSQLSPSAVRNLNMAELVIVPSQWNADCFHASGVKKPIRVCHLGMDSKVYSFAPTDMEGPTVFGAAGRLANGGTRKGVNEAIELFQKAFAAGENVRLKIKGFVDCPIIPIHDHRIEVLRDYISDTEMANWLRSLTCLVALAKGEGWGAIQHQSLMVGRPVIGPIFGGVAMFLREQNSFPVSYVLGQPPKGNHYEGLGYWAIPSDGSAIAQMQAVHANRQEARARGMQGALQMSMMTNIESNRALESVLKEFGAL